jgi:hypothetical protein
MIGCKPGPGVERLPLDTRGFWGEAAVAPALTHCRGATRQVQGLLSPPPAARGRCQARQFHFQSFSFRNPVFLAKTCEWVCAQASQKNWTVAASTSYFLLLTLIVGCAESTFLIGLIGLGGGFLIATFTPSTRAHDVALRLDRPAPQGTRPGARHRRAAPRSCG